MFEHPLQISEPECSRIGDNYWDTDCGNSTASIIYFCSFYVLIAYIVINLLVGMPSYAVLSYNTFSLAICVLISTLTLIPSLFPTLNQTPNDDPHSYFLSCEILLLHKMSLEQMSLSYRHYACLSRDCSFLIYFSCFKLYLVSIWFLLFCFLSYVIGLQIWNNKKEHSRIHYVMSL